MVMPCSRSASSPSTSSAKSMSSPLRAVLLRIALERGQLVLEDQLGVVEQPADQRRLAVVDRAAGQEAQQRLLLLRRQDSRGCRPSRRCRLRPDVLHDQKYPSRFFFSIEPASSLVDQPALALGGARRQHLADDLLQAVGVGFDRAGQRIAAERAEAHHAVLDDLAGLELHPLVVDHDQHAVALDHRPLAWRNRAARSGCSSCRMYCQMSSSVQFDSGNTRIDSPGATRVL